MDNLTAKIEFAKKGTAPGAGIDYVIVAIYSASIEFILTITKICQTIQK